MLTLTCSVSRQMWRVSGSVCSHQKGAPLKKRCAVPRCLLFCATCFGTGLCEGDSDRKQPNFHVQSLPQWIAKGINPAVIESEFCLVFLQPKVIPFCILLSRKWCWCTFPCVLALVRPCSVDANRSEDVLVCKESFFSLRFSF